MEHELNVTKDVDPLATSDFHTGEPESQYYTSVATPTPNDASRNARVFPTLLKEYQSKDIKEVKREGQTIKYVRKGKGNKLGAGGQASGIYEVVVDTGVEHAGLNPRYQTYAAKKFRGLCTDSLYGQWQEQVHGLSEYYGGFICQFHGYCRDYDNYEGSNEYSDDDFETASDMSSETALEIRSEIASEVRSDKSFEMSSETASQMSSETASQMSSETASQMRSEIASETSSDEGYESAFENAFEAGSFCLLMRKYDCSLRKVIDEEMTKNHSNGRPLLPGVALSMMVHIVAGMKIVHQENIIHRDLKADNVFVYKDAIDNMPWGAFIGDFDISDSTSGTAYWRAPEILEATAKRKVDREAKIPWTPMADVYSFGMTCYEILTGGIPLKSHPRDRYQDVSQGGLRPILPADLNPDVKKLIVRCWHQDPLQRPTFDAILLELREILHEFPLFLEALDKVKKLPPMRNRPSTEECISRLERQFQDLRSKYPMQFFVRRNEVDFVKMGFHFVKCINRVVRKFGYKPYIEHPSPLWSLWYARFKWIDKLWRLSSELGHALPYFEEKRVITILSFYILTAICEGRETGNSWTEEEGINASQKEAKWSSWLENIQKRPPLVDRHHGCIQKSNYGHYEGNKDYPICRFCKEKTKVDNVQNAKFRLFDTKFASDVV